MEGSAIEDAGRDIAVEGVTEVAQGRRRAGRGCWVGLQLPKRCLKTSKTPIRTKVPGTPQSARHFTLTMVGAELVCPVRM